MKSHAKIVIFVSAFTISQLIIVSGLALLYVLSPQLNMTHESLGRFLVDILCYPYLFLLLFGAGYILLRKLRSVISLWLLTLSFILYYFMTLYRLTFIGHTLLLSLAGITVIMLAIGHWSKTPFFHWCALATAFCCFFIIVSIQFAPPLNGRFSLFALPRVTRLCDDGGETKRPDSTSLNENDMAGTTE